MSETPIKLRYKIRSGNDSRIDYSFKDTGEGITLIHEPPSEDAAWIKLEHEQCTNCPLDTSTHPNCPVAENLAMLMEDCDKTISYEQVELEVITQQRTISAQTSAQKALSSLLGLIMATSDCPHTDFFRPMAQFHLPLATREETTYRAISTYLLTQYMKHSEGQTVDYDLDGLAEIYKKMHTVNVCMNKRIKSAIDSDTALNAVVILDILAITLPNYLTEELNNLKPYFSKLL